jgi:hypothetical protein
METVNSTVKDFASQSKLTLEEFRRARPPRGNGAPSRTRSHYARILALLRERGAAGVLSSELYDSPNLFGRSPRNRISELRRDGHLIRTVPAGASVVCYILTFENLSPIERPALRVVPKSSTTAPIPAWENRPRATGLPLWDLAVQS